MDKQLSLADKGTIVRALDAAFSKRIKSALKKHAKQVQKDYPDFVITSVTGKITPFKRWTSFWRMYRVSLKVKFSDAKLTKLGISPQDVDLSVLLTKDRSTCVLSHVFKKEAHAKLAIAKRELQDAQLELCRKIEKRVAQELRPMLEKLLEDKMATHLPKVIFNDVKAWLDRVSTDSLT